MKKFLPALITFILIGLVLNHGASALNRVGNNMNASFLRDCDKGTVKVEKSNLFGLPTSVSVEGRNCAGPDSAYQGYRADIWDHFFRLL